MNCLHNINSLLFCRQFCFLLLLFIAACGTKPQEDKNRIPLVRVGSIFLYKDELQDLVPDGTPAADSAEMTKRYIDNWIKETLILIKAEENLGDIQKDIKKKLDDYKKSLITYAYEEELISQKLDTTVSPQEIDQYYNEHQPDFELKDNIVKVTYVRVKKNAPKLDKVKQWYKSENEKDITQLKSYCLQFAENYFIDNNSWLLFDDLLKEIPIKMYDKELFLQNNRYIELQDSLNNYLVNIKGFKIKNSISPLSFEKENIRSIIINKRKLQLIEKMKEDVYKEAIEKKKIEILN